MTLSRDEVKRRVDRIVDQYRAAGAGPSVISATVTDGKLYEAWVLCEVLRQLRYLEGFKIVLRQGTTIHLKSAAGPINRAYPYFELTKEGQALELWTDVEFEALSYTRARHKTAITRGDFHELDLVVVPAQTDGRPSPDEVHLGVECKRTDFGKHLLRGVLGVRRELSLLARPTGTVFQTWPSSHLPADPPSCLLVYTTDARVAAYAKPGEYFGIEFIHFPLP
jgi:hypothetical protein